MEFDLDPLAHTVCGIWPINHRVEYLLNQLNVNFFQNRDFDLFVLGPWWHWIGQIPRGIQSGSGVGCDGELERGTPWFSKIHILCEVKHLYRKQLRGHMLFWIAIFSCSRRLKGVFLADETERLEEQPTTYITLRTQILPINSWLTVCTQEQHRNTEFKHVKRISMYHSLKSTISNSKFITISQDFLHFVLINQGRWTWTRAKCGVSFDTHSSSQRASGLHALTVLLYSI